jgi:hydroxymethylglutaryl-CoA lyase
LGFGISLGFEIWSFLGSWFFSTFTLMKKIHLVECPRDAMQGWKTIIPTPKKINYLNALLRVGFDTLDFGSFVSAKAIPQMADTPEVLQGLTLDGSNTKLLVIIANLRGAQTAIQSGKITYLGFPFSVSETFQLRNTNSTIAESLERVREIQNLCISAGKQLVVYLSMGFGNPYGDPYSNEIVFTWAERLAALDVRIISLADTVGLATPEQVFSVTDYLVRALPDRSIGVHLHSSPVNWKPKLEAALKAGCLRFDGALKGIGGCPMANDELVGNMNMENMIAHFDKENLAQGIDRKALAEALEIAGEVFHS